MKEVTAVLLSLLLGTSLAQAFGDVYLSVKKDPITDENQSVLFVGEVNDTDALTFIRIQCVINKYEVYFRTKHALYLTNEEGKVFETPSVTYRFDSIPPVINVETSSVFGATTEEVLTNVVTFHTEDSAKKFLKGALTAKKLVVRINRLKGQPLDYTFNLSGFKTAFQKMACPAKI